MQCVTIMKVVQAMHMFEKLKENYYCSTIQVPYQVGLNVD